MWTIFAFFYIFKHITDVFFYHPLAYPTYILYGRHVSIYSSFPIDYSLSNLPSFHQLVSDEPRVSCNKANAIRAVGKVWLEAVAISTLVHISHVWLRRPSDEKAQNS